MSRKSYCEENGRERILQQWDREKKLPLMPDTVAHTGTVPRLVAVRKGTLLVYAGAQPLQKLHWLPEVPGGMAGGKTEPAHGRSASTTGRHGIKWWIKATEKVHGESGERKYDLFLR